MSEEQIEWRDAWKKLIDASRDMILRGDKNDETPFNKLTSLQDDKMLLFEKAIAYESLGNKDKAIELYEKSSDENDGLSVAHWRKRAKYFLNRLKKRGGFCITDINTGDPTFNVQWDVYFNMHHYAYLDDYVRYLAISSVSRIYLEPAMAIVIFRTCLEVGLYTYFSNTVEKINKSYKCTHDNLHISLDALLREMKNLFDNNQKHLFKSKGYEYYDKIRRAGNAAPLLH